MPASTARTRRKRRRGRGGRTRGQSIDSGIALPRFQTNSVGYRIILPPVRRLAFWARLTGAFAAAVTRRNIATVIIAHAWPLPPARNSAPTKFNRRWARAAWEKCTVRVDTRLDRTVAIKVLASHLSSSPELKQRMEREARAISSLNHPHICQLYDIGSQDGTDYLVMEFLEGETLAERLRKGATAAERSLQNRDCRRGGSGGRAPPGHCAPRSEAGKHHADARLERS